MANCYFSSYSRVSDVKRCVHDAWRQIQTAPDSNTKSDVIMILGRLLDAPDNKFNIRVDDYSNGEHLLYADIEDSTRKEYYDGAIVDSHSFYGHFYPLWKDGKDFLDITADIHEYYSRLDRNIYPAKRTEKEYTYKCMIRFSRNKVTKFRLMKEGAPWIYL